MKMNGWITLHRRIQEHWIWQDDKKFKRWVDLIMMAAWETTAVRFFKVHIRLKRGQLITSVRTLMHRWRTNSRYVTEFLADLENEAMIVCVRNKTYTIITIINYDQYQSAQGAAEEVQSPPPKTGETEHNGIHQRPHDSSTYKQDNNINNSPHQNTRDGNEKFFLELKSSDLFFDQMAASLHCDQNKLMLLLEDFYNEVSAKGTEHHSAGDFKKHFFDWARIQLQKKNGTRGKQDGGGGGNAQDRYATRRGTDVGNYTSKDYGGPF